MTYLKDGDINKIVKNNLNFEKLVFIDYIKNYIFIKL